MRERRAILVFALIHAGIFLGLFVAQARWSGTAPGAVEHWFALQMLDGQLPYRDFDIEYPPLALLAFLVPGILFRDPAAYTWAFAGEMLLLDLAVLALLAALAFRLRVSAWGTLGLYTLAILAAGPIVVSRYDLLPAALVIAALYGFITRRDRLTWAMLALGVAAKLYPALIAPLFALYYLRNRQHWRLLQGGAVFAVILLATMLPFVWLSPDGFWHLVSYHAERGLHSETSYASVLLIGQALGFTRVEAGLTFGSWNLSSPLADTLARLSPFIALALLLVVYALYARSLWRRPDLPQAGASLSPHETEQVISYSLLVVLVFLLTSKVFSPQFLVWLCPLLPLIGGRLRYVLLGLFGAVGGLTQYIYPHHYIEFEMGRPLPVAMLAGRNWLIMVMALFLPALRNKGYLTPDIHSAGERASPGKESVCLRR